MHAHLLVVICRPEPRYVAVVGGVEAALKRLCVWNLLCSVVPMRVCGQVL